MEFISKEPWLYWSSNLFQLRHQFDAWHSALNQSHLRWKLNKPISAKFFGEIKMRHLGGIRIVYCNCEPCGGARTKQEIAKCGEAYFGLLFILNGSELVKIRNETALLGKGTLLLWDSTQTVEFELIEPLKKVTLFIPQDQLRMRVPRLEPYIGKRINIHRGVGAITASHVAALANESAHIQNGRGDSIVDLTLELIATCLQVKENRPMTLAKKEFLTGIKTYIKSNLEDPELGPVSIAKHFNISARYLHILFEYTGTSVSKWIQRKRLEQCRRDLLRIERSRHNITDIAFKWGFNDSAHFSRLFKNYYRLSPSDYQKRYFN
jgi:AraC-like DNA-binding protein